MKKSSSVFMLALLIFAQILYVGGDSEKPVAPARDNAPEEHEKPVAPARDNAPEEREKPVAPARDNAPEGRTPEVPQPSKPKDVVTKIDALPHQKVIAFIAALVGVWSIVGPSSFRRFLFELVGAAVAGLLVASGINFVFNHAENTAWLESALQLVRGSAFQDHKLALIVWFLFTLISLVRWLTGFECGLWGVADDMYVNKDGTAKATTYKEPLLNEKAKQQV